MKPSEADHLREFPEAPKGFRRLLPRGLSGKLLVLTITFVMIAEVLILVPSIANFRQTWIRQHLEMAEAVISVFEKVPQQSISRDVQDGLLNATDALAIVVRTGTTNNILASDTMPVSVEKQSFIPAESKTRPIESIIEAFDTLLYGGKRAIRVYQKMQHRSGLIELVMKDGKLRDAMLIYARNVMLISLAISLFTALLVFFSIRWLLIRPMQRMTRNMTAYSSDPENPELVIKPSGGDDEMALAEVQLADMQNRLQRTLQQQKNLADLGLAVSKINHDLRNILASAQLFSDRLTALPDPTVQRLAPKLVRTIDRAVSYTQSVLSYGKANEAPPDRRLIFLHRVAEDVAELLTLDQSDEVEWKNDVPAELEVFADSEQLFRVLLNLSRNGLQAMEQDMDAAHIRRLTVSGHHERGQTVITVSDTGPGVPDKARQSLFEAFKGSTRSGGTGLGLAIAAELIGAHGGSISLINPDQPGASFEIRLPRPQSQPQRGELLRVVGQ